MASPATTLRTTIAILSTVLMMPSMFLIAAEVKLAAHVPITLDPIFSLPFIELAVGTPPSKTIVLLDTGSEMIWTQCEPCKRCFNQTSNIFSPSSSSTFSVVSCEDPRCMLLPAGVDIDCSSDNSEKSHCPYKYDYGFEGGASTIGALATENFKIGNPIARGIVFGCSNNSTQNFPYGDGVAGFGRGKLSLPAQLKLDKFSYCVPFPSPVKKKGIVSFGSEAKLLGKNSRSIRFKNDSMFQYYLSWTGAITVGDIKLRIPKEKLETSETESIGGMYIDTGSVSYLEESLFWKMVRAFEIQMKKFRRVTTEINKQRSVCFRLQQQQTEGEEIGVPRLVYHFENGVDWEFGRVENYFEVRGNEMCLRISPAKTSVLGVDLQYGTEILFDLEKESLYFNQEGSSC